MRGHRCRQTRCRAPAGQTSRSLFAAGNTPVRNGQNRGGMDNQDLAPTIAALGTSLNSIEILESFGCRPRNGVSGAQVSEHGHANALDVGSFKLRMAK